MKGECTLRILEIIAEAARTTGDLLDCFLTDYATSYRRLRGLPQRIADRRDRAVATREERQRFYNLLAKLKKDGLACQTKSDAWRPTPSGIECMHKLLKRKQRLLPVASYAPATTGGYKLVAFDIPERERRKRAWLRAALRNLKFRPLQKSLWIGNAELPRQFLEDARTLHLLHYLEILAVTKTGTLRHLV